MFLMDWYKIYRLIRTKKQQLLRGDGHAYAVIKTSRIFRENLTRPSLWAFFQLDMNHQELVDISSKKQQKRTTSTCTLKQTENCLRTRWTNPKIKFYELIPLNMMIIILLIRYGWGNLQRCFQWVRQGQQWLHWSGLIEIHDAGNLQKSRNIGDWRIHWLPDEILWCKLRWQNYPCWICRQNETIPKMISHHIIHYHINSIFFPHSQ